jgi:hypothetical protein
MKHLCLFQWGLFLHTFMIEMPLNCWFSLYVAKGKFRCCILLSSMLQQTDVWVAPKTFTCVWLEMLGWSGSNLLFCLVGGMRYGMDDSFHSVSGSHVS